MMKAWQLVDINGEVINEEDVSSVGMFNILFLIFVLFLS